MTVAVHILRPDAIDFGAYLHETEGSERVRPASDYVTEMARDLGKPRVITGHPFPWRKLRDCFMFRPGEVTLWGGQNGHGKSLVTGMLALEFIAKRQRVCIASFEMKPVKTLERMLRQWTGFNANDPYAQTADSVSAMRDLYEQFATQASGTLWLYDQQGTVRAEQMISVARYCAKELQMQHIFVDSLMKCVAGEDDYNGQKNLVDELSSIARDYGCHVHLVHHIRKLENESKVPDKNDIKGSGSITDQVDNVWLVWRNKTPPDKRKADADYDAMLICCKQRHGDGWEGAARLWYDNESQQFCEDKGAVINFAERCA